MFCGLLLFWQLLLCTQYQESSAAAFTPRQNRFEKDEPLRNASPTTEATKGTTKVESGKKKHRIMQVK